MNQINLSSELLNEIVALLSEMPAGKVYTTLKKIELAAQESAQNKEIHAAATTGASEEKNSNK